jgi:hypothetical protein
MNEARLAFQTQALAIHHPSCSQLKRVKNPKRVWVKPGADGWRLETNEGDWVLRVACCGRHYHTREIEAYDWRYPEDE